MPYTAKSDTLKAQTNERKSMGTITKHPFDLKDKPGWLEIRKALSDEGRLGGSDIGSAVGDNPYKSPMPYGARWLACTTQRTFQTKRR